MSKRVPALMRIRESLCRLIDGETSTPRRPWRTGEAGDAADLGGGAGGGNWDIVKRGFLNTSSSDLPILTCPVKNTELPPGFYASRVVVLSRGRLLRLSVGYGKFRRC